MRTLATALGVLLVASVVVVAQEGKDQEQKASVSSCPEAVQKTLKHEAGNGRIVEVETEREDGRMICEVEVQFGDLEYEIEIREDGTLLSKTLEGHGEEGDDNDEQEEKEEKVQMGDLPKAVLKTLNQESHGGQIEEIEKEQEGGKIVYEAEILFGEKEYEIEITEDGTLLSKVLENENDAKGTR